MLKRRQGFTLIELLIVIVIIGILAAIAIPKFGKTREKAYFKAMVSDLRSLNTQQEMYYSLPANSYSYAATTASLPDLAVSQGVTVTVVNGNTLGWLATAGHVALNANQTCAIYIGTAAAVPAYVTSPGVIACTNE